MGLDAALAEVARLEGGNRPPPTVQALLNAEVSQASLRKHMSVGAVEAGLMSIVDRDTPDGCGHTWARRSTARPHDSPPCASRRARSARAHVRGKPRRWRQRLGQG